MFRYLERAENTARLIETGQRIALTRLGSTEDEWRSVLQTASACQGYDAHHDAITKDDPAGRSSVSKPTIATSQDKANRQGKHLKAEQSRIVGMPGPRQNRRLAQGEGFGSSRGNPSAVQK